MKLAVFGEDTADEVATRILVEAILQEETESVGLFQFRGRGYTNILATLQTVLLHLHYRTEADALVAVIDSDETPVHTSIHDLPDQRDGRCFFHRESFGLKCHRIFANRDELCERADAILVRPRIDLVAWLESPNLRPDSDDDSGQISAQDER